MKNKKGNNNKYIFKKILLGIFGIFICGGIAKFLVPKMYLLFMNLLGISVNLLGDVIICVSVLGIIGTFGLAIKCLDFKISDVYDDNMDVDLMCQESKGDKIDTKSCVSEIESVNKYAYVYGDVEDIEIDDIMNPNWRRDYGFDDIDEYDDMDVKIYTRKKNH